MPQKNGKRRTYRINVGDRVRYPNAGSGFRAEVIEDRGHIGYGGRRLLQIRTFADYEESRLEFAVPEEELELME